MIIITNSTAKLYFLPALLLQARGTRKRAFFLSYLFSAITINIRIIYEMRSLLKVLKCFLYTDLFLINWSGNIVSLGLNPHLFIYSLLRIN
jgi:hypothetical protein